MTTAKADPSGPPTTATTTSASATTFQSAPTEETAGRDEMSSIAESDQSSEPLLHTAELDMDADSEEHPVAARVDQQLWPWLLFFLTGNTTIASRRQTDLSTYLRLNLAARLDADYNDVTINRIVMKHACVLVNVSVEPSHLDGVGRRGLDDLGQGNVTLLELSGQEFLVERILRADELSDERSIFIQLV